MMEPLHFQSVLEFSDNKLWTAHFVVPALIADTLLAGKSDRRVVCRLNDRVEYQCALIPFGEGKLVITVNKKNQTLLKIKTGSVLQVSVWPDVSEYGLPMPEELKEVLEQDEEGSRLFHALTPGKIRTLLYLVGQPKSSDIRLQRAVAVVEHLILNKGKIDYKILNQAMRAQP
ncbi:MAG: DUF1905 domain-containing protein [Chitinophagales bacterium]|nr:DUF1905 domain-containing protein [Chitinophagales bacterium]